jgi:hypothetical protein
VQLGAHMAFTLATHLCGGRCSLSGVVQRTAKHAAKIEPLIALGLHPHCGPAGGVDALKARAIPTR